MAYPNFEDFPFDKATTWSSIKKQLGTEEKRTRKPLKQIIKERYMQNITQGTEGDDEAKIRADEDEQILKTTEDI